MLHVYHRSTCRLCNSPNVELAVKLDPIPLAENYTLTREEARETPCFPVDLYMCADCGHVQQLDVVDADYLWSKYTYFSGAAKGMPEHFEEVAARIMKEFPLPENSLVVDIGSNDGSLLLPFQKAGLRVLGVDPAEAAAAKANDRGVPTIVAPMSLELARRIRAEHGPARVVCMFNAFAHMDNLQEMLDAIATLLDKDGIFVFESQYIGDIIEKRLIATIFHEHMSHHSAVALEPFFRRHGMELIDLSRAPIQHGSIIGVAQLQGGAHAARPSVAALLEMERRQGLDKIDSLRAFAADIADMRSRIHAWAQARRAEGAVLAGYGAARSGPTLIAQLGLTGMLEYVFDDHPQKVGRFSSGEGLPIVPTRELYERMPPYTVILAWVHAAKIIQEHRKYVEQGGAFVVLCPEPRLVPRDGESPL